MLADFLKWITYAIRTFSKSFFRSVYTSTSEVQMFCFAIHMQVQKTTVYLYITK